MFRAQQLVAVILILSQSVADGYKYRSMMLRKRLALKSTEEEEGAAGGEFKISKPSAPRLTGLGDENATEPAFRQVRQPSPLSDNLIIVGSTLAGLLALVALFLFLNKDVPPPPY